MFSEYYDWLREHPEATEEQKKEMWEKCLRMHEARNMLTNLLLAYRY